MNEQETVADIIAEKRRQADKIERDVAEKMKRGEMTSDQYARELVADIRREADRLEAAHKREVDALKQRCAELDAEVAAKDEVIKRLNDAIAEEQRRKVATAEKSSAVGDCANLREALKKCPLYIACSESVGIETITLNDKVKLDPKKIIKSAKAALAATEGGNNEQK